MSGGVKQRAGNRPYALGYAPNPSAEEFGANKRRFGFFARRRMVREGLLGTDSLMAISSAASIQQRHHLIRGRRMTSTV